MPCWARNSGHSGYPGANEHFWPWSAGETQGFCSLGFGHNRGDPAGWVRDRKVNIFVQLALRRASEHPESALGSRSRKTRRPIAGHRN